MVRKTGRSLPGHQTWNSRFWPPKPLRDVKGVGEFWFEKMLFVILFSSYLALSCLTHANVGRVKTTAPLNIYIVYVSRNPTYLNQMRSGQFTLLDHFYETCEQLILPVYNPYRFLLYAYLILFFEKAESTFGQKNKILWSFPNIGELWCFSKDHVRVHGFNGL